VRRILDSLDPIGTADAEQLGSRVAIGDGMGAREPPEPLLSPRLGWKSSSSGIRNSHQIVPVSTNCPRFPSQSRRNAGEKMSASRRIVVSKTGIDN
jgi:hypothetical protein